MWFCYTKYVEFSLLSIYPNFRNLLFNFYLLLTYELLRLRTSQQGKTFGIHSIDFNLDSLKLSFLTDSNLTPSNAYIFYIGYSSLTNTIFSFFFTSFIFFFKISSFANFWSLEHSDLSKVCDRTICIEIESSFKACFYLSFLISL